MRKLAALGAAAALFTTTLSTPAWAAAPEAPTDVQVSWTDDGKIRVTWKDNGEANQVVAAFPDTGYRVAMPTSDAPNEIYLSPGRLEEAPKVRISVRSSGADDALSEPAHSPLFDTRKASNPSLWRATSVSATSVRLRWTQDAVAEDTPNDPLDQADGEWLRASVSGPNGMTEFRIPGGAKEADIPVPAGSATISLSARNEWGWGVAPTRGFQKVQVSPVRVSTVFPAQASWTGFSIKGMVQVSEIPPGDTLNFEVQARPNSSSPWQKIGIGSSWEKPGTIIPALPGASGGREYRLFVAASESEQGNVLFVLPAASTAGKFVRKHAYIAAGFAPNRARVSATVKLKVNVLPALPLKAALHKWDGKQWRYVRAVQLSSKGTADLAIRAAGRGTTQKYRIATPPVKVNGLPVELSTSATFTLTVV